MHPGGGRSNFWSWLLDAAQVDSGHDRRPSPIKRPPTQDARRETRINERVSAENDQQEVHGCSPPRRQSCVKVFS